MARIVAETERVFDPGRLWPAHPLDGDSPAVALYAGAAGVIFAIDRLAEQGAVLRVRDWTPIVESLVDRPRVGIEAHPLARSGFMFGEVGISLVGHRVTRGRVFIERLIAAGRGSLGHESNELCAGEPGALLATAALVEETGDPRLRELVRDLATSIRGKLAFDPDHGCALWTQSWGARVAMLGCVHGFAGNACALIRAGHARDLEPEIERTFVSTARVENGFANWPQSVGTPLPGREAMLVQICHGAPGVIVALARLAKREGSRLEELLRMGGELTWRAGPLAKGSGLCHGTAGNGYAFLCLYRRTGGGIWLDRARAFAMHAIGQWEGERAHHGRGRTSLWTGDLGLACFLWDCVRERDEFPTLHGF